MIMCIWLNWLKLTFNARRGGEPGKLTLKDWRMVEIDSRKMKKDKEWLKDPAERKLVDHFPLCYMEGKKTKRGIFYILLWARS